MKKLLALTLLLVCTGITMPVAADNSVTGNISQTLKEVITVPAGVCFNVLFMQPVNSEAAYTGQEINLALGSDFVYNNTKIAPAGSSVIGTVIEVAKAKHGSLNGKVTFRFTHIITPAGYNIPISAIVKTDDKSGTLYGTSKFEASNEYMRSQGISSDLGISHVNNPLKAGDTRLVGSGGGLVKSIWDKGSDVFIPVNTAMELILTQPITVSPSTFENK